MLVVRPSRAADLDGVLGLAAKAGAGLTTLPNDVDALRRRIAGSEAAFAAQIDEPGDQSYLFVLEDTASGALVGTCGIVAAVGLGDAFYNYRVGLSVHASRELGVYNRIPTLSLSNDLTGSTELGTLFLDPEFRHGGVGRLLSKARFLFMAHHPRRFADRVIAELRGVADDSGRSPFWDGLGRYFFSMDFSRADALSATDTRAFIAELMPKHPLYTVLLGPEAQAVIGEVHAQTRPARRMLEEEGFRYRGYVDIFDAGPALEAERDLIASVRNSAPVPLAATEPAGGAGQALVAAGVLSQFRCVLCAASSTPDGLSLEVGAARSLGANPGDPLRCLPLPPHRSASPGQPARD